MKHALIYKDYNDALKENRILGVKCLACGQVMTPPKMVCPSCGASDMEITEFKGTGKVRTFTTVYVGAEGREAEVPYVIVIVELDEGPWIMGNLDGIDPKEVSMDIVGKPVSIESSRVFEGDAYSGGEGARPVFTLA